MTEAVQILYHKGMKDKKFIKIYLKENKGNTVPNIYSKLELKKIFAYIYYGYTLGERNGN